MNGGDVNTSVVFTKKQEQKNVTVYFFPSYSQNFSPGIVTSAQIYFTLKPMTGFYQYESSGRYSTMDISSRPSLTVPPGTYEVRFLCTNIWVKQLNETTEHGFGVSGYAYYDYPETFTVSEDNNVISVNVSIRK